MKKRYDCQWGMMEELEFINKLGTLTRAGQKKPKSYWLKKYLESMETRQSWGELIKDRLQAYVVQLLVEAVKKEGGTNETKQEIPGGSVRSILGSLS